MAKKESIKEVEEDTVDYCAKCYSIDIKYEDSIGMDCCRKCGCTDFKTTTWDKWEELYKGRYGHKFVEDEGSLRNHPFFTMSLEKLKATVYKNPLWKVICRTLYPTFPNYLSKADSIILLFAKLIQENRLDDLRMEMINRTKK